MWNKRFKIFSCIFTSFTNWTFLNRWLLWSDQEWRALAHVLCQRWCLWFLQLYLVRSCSCWSTCFLCKYIVLEISVLKSSQYQHNRCIQLWKAANIIVLLTFLFTQDSPLRFTSSVWGPTCDGLDCIIKECRLPEMEVGQWMYFPDMGAYTIAAGSTFNGMPRPSINYICSQDIW